MNNILLVPERKFSLSYACAEMLWYLSGQNNIELIQAYAPQYKRFTEDGIAYGAYGHRWKNSPGFVKEKNALTNQIIIEGDGSSTDFSNLENQLHALIYLLRRDPSTRQAVMTMWDSGDLVHAILGDHEDLPCTLSLCFFVRSSKLYLVATMRSNDAWLGLPYDIFCFTTLQQIIASELNLKLGSYIHQAGSEHIYKKDRQKANKITNSLSEFAYPHFTKINHMRRSQTLDWNIREALSAEKKIRKEKSCSVLRIDELNNLLDPIFKDLVLGCATKWTSVPGNSFSNNLFSLCQEFYGT